MSRRSSYIAWTCGSVCAVMVVLTCTGNIELARPFEGAHRILECARDVSEGVVYLGGRPVEAHAHRADPEVAKPVDCLSLQQRRRARRDRHVNRERAPVLDQLGNVRPLERVAAGQDEHAAKLLDAAHQGLALLGAELARVAMRNRARSAMLTREVARDRRLPIDVARLATVKEPRVIGSDGFKLHQLCSFSRTTPPRRSAQFSG